MNAKKNAKNADKGSENLDAQCRVCGTEKKVYKMLGAGKSRMVYECKCGILDKGGKKI
ncbi:MAG: hypothetical protein JW795_05380 [Chitinivibrionales bacterium]|nr:hypothetical protein [Chitinivibrionales bacterium]